ncbi:hypothetical protein LDENG_00265520 [Lucifuga dentata]|nr:hypothetical protein LDENG_00265520 [Lucifuga dentata]
MAGGVKSASPAASGSGGAAAASSSLKSKGMELLRKLRVSVELLIALAALLSWLVVGVVMFDFVEYKAVPDIQQVITDPVQAVNDAVDEVSSLLNKFQECAPDLSDPTSAATYAVEEIAVAKDGFVRYFSDEEGTTDISFMDPVIIGRNAISVANDAANGITGKIQELLCAIFDNILDIMKGTTEVSYIDPVVIGRNSFSVINDFVSGITRSTQDVLCAILDVVLDMLTDLQHAVGFSPMTVLKRTAEITKEQTNMLADYVSTTLIGEQGILPDVAIDPMKIVTDAVLEMTDKKDLFLGYISSMFIGDQGEPVATPPVVNIVTEKDETVASPADINLVRRKGEFLPPIEKGK